MRFGARRLLFPGLALVAAGLAVLHAGARSTPTTSPTSCRSLVLLGAGVGICLPGADDARDVGRDAGGCGTRLGPGQHLRPGRRRARPGGAGDAVDVAQRRARGRGGDSTASALTSGYHLAFWVAAGLVVRSDRRRG